MPAVIPSSLPSFVPFSVLWRYNDLMQIPIEWSYQSNPTSDTRCHVRRMWLYTGFGLVIGFTGHFNNHYHKQTSVLSHDLHCVALVAASNCGCSPSSGFRTVSGLSYQLLQLPTDCLLADSFCRPTPNQVKVTLRLTVSQPVMLSSPMWGSSPDIS
jgi:hypothetical protein